MRGPLVFDHGRPTIRLEQERNGPDVRERFHGVFFACASGDSVGAVPAGGWLHALRVFVATAFVVCRGSGVVFARRFALDADRVSHPPIHISLRTEDSLGKAAALCDSWSASRLSQRRAAARHAASHKHSARVSFFRSILSNFWKPGAGGVCRVGFRLSLL